MSGLVRALKSAAEGVSAFFLAAMFVTFVAQIFWRYILNNPLHWAEELCVTIWIWAVFWTCAFVLREPDHVRFDVVYGLFGPTGRRVMSLIVAVSIAAAFALSLYPTLDFIQFKGIKRAATLPVTFDIIFSVYAIFAIAMIVKYSVRAWHLLRGATPESLDAEART